jgi:hypothetical protein
MRRGPLEGDHDLPPAGGEFNRRRLFELGATSLGVAAVLAACGGDEEGDPGRVGQAPAAADLPDLEVDDAVYLRTMTSLQYSILSVYGTLLEIDGLDEDVAALLERLSADHQTAADDYASLTTEAGGEAYECENQWIMGRTLQPLLDHVTGTEGDGAIAPTDDPGRDALTLAGALETTDAATAQLFVERLTDPALRAAVIGAGVAASMRAATTALRSNPPPDGYVSPALSGGTVTPDENGLIPQYAISSRFGQLTPVEVSVGAQDENGQRFGSAIQTPAENAYVYHGATCPA